MALRENPQVAAPGESRARPFFWRDVFYVARRLPVLWLAFGLVLGQLLADLSWSWALRSLSGEAASSEVRVLSNTRTLSHGWDSGADE
jgi:hypothetical protein